jgi:hypothetical protein
VAVCFNRHGVLCESIPSFTLFLSQLLFFSRGARAVHASFVPQHRVALPGHVRIPQRGSQGLKLFSLNCTIGRILFIFRLLQKREGLAAKFVAVAAHHAWQVLSGEMSATPGVTFNV